MKWIVCLFGLIASLWLSAQENAPAAKAKTAAAKGGTAAAKSGTAAVKNKKAVVKTKNGKDTAAQQEKGEKPVVPPSSYGAVSLIETRLKMYDPHNAPLLNQDAINELAKHYEVTDIPTYTSQEAVLYYVYIDSIRFQIDATNKIALLYVFSEGNGTVTTGIRDLRSLGDASTLLAVTRGDLSGYVRSRDLLTFVPDQLQGDIAPGWYVLSPRKPLINLPTKAQ